MTNIHKTKMRGEGNIRIIRTGMNAYSHSERARIAAMDTFTCIPRGVSLLLIIGYLVNGPMLDSIDHRLLPSLLATYQERKCTVCERSVLFEFFRPIYPWIYGARWKR